jgi:histidyl-tRNA synthetase
MPPEAGRWRRFSATFAETVEAAGYECIIPPMFEDIGVFQRLGEATDVVTKEMYDFVDKGDRHIALRPEHTASVCRAFVEHRPVVPWKVWYSGSNFRYEKAQAGRYRQFDQVGIEVLGVDDAHLDVEVIALGWQFFERIGLRDVSLMVNSLGDAGDRQRYVAALESYFSEHIDQLSDDAKATLLRNPLRVLDSKRESDRSVIESAPTIASFLSEEAAIHFNAVCTGLERIGVPFVVNEHLVRGLDYYRRTTFEYISSALSGAQNAIGGGGRYDGLVEELGGPATSGIGFALGVDRTLLACDAEGVFTNGSQAIDAFVIDVVDGVTALSLTMALREAGFVADRGFDGRSMKSQMKAADRAGARCAVIIGSDEHQSGTCTVRDLATSEQITIPQTELVAHLATVVGSRNPRRLSQ